MKFAAIIEYGPDKEKVKAHHPAHREYLRRFLETVSCAELAPFADDAGALWILDAETAEAVEDIVKGDPYVAAGVLVKWQIRPIEYWSAQGDRGAR